MGLRQMSCTGCVDMWQAGEPHLAAPHLISSPSSTITPPTHSPLPQDRFAPLLQQCSQLIAAGENTDKRVSEILAEADEFVDQVSG